MLVLPVSSETTNLYYGPLTSFVSLGGQVLYTNAGTNKLFQLEF